MQEKKGLNNTTTWLMIGTAIFFDALQALLTFIFMGWLVSVFASLTFWLWFRLHGISFMKPKRLLTFGGASLVELVPFLSIIPAWTAAVAYLALETKVMAVAGKIPGGQIALNVAGNKIIQNKNSNQVNNMARVKSMSNDGTAANLAGQREKPNERFSDEAFNKRMKEREEHFERMRQMGQRADQLKYGGGSKEGLEQHLAKSKKEWDIGTGITPRDEAA